MQDETAEGLLGIHSMEKAVKNRHEDGEEGEDDEEPKTINSHTAQKVDEDRSDAPEVLIKDLDDRYSSEVEDEQLGAERASNKPPTLRHTPDDFQRQRSILQRSRLYKPFVASFQENLTQDQTDTKFLGLSRLKRESSWTICNGSKSVSRFLLVLRKLEKHTPPTLSLRSKQREGRKVLVCSSANKAVTNILKRNRREFSKDEFLKIRVWSNQ